MKIFNKIKLLLLFIVILTGGLFLAACQDPLPTSLKVLLSKGPILKERIISIIATDEILEFTVEIKSSNDGKVSITLPNGEFFETSSSSGITKTIYGWQEIELLAKPKTGTETNGEFTKWSDGNTENPRIITVVGNITLTAEMTKAEDSSGNSPFLYSEDENGNIYFEHEPISFAMAKVFEHSTFGTLRLIQDVNGVYYIQIIEEGGSITALNGAKLYALDYVNDGEVIDVLFDIFGVPHTIKQQIMPISINEEYNEVLNHTIITFDKDEDVNFGKLMINARSPQSIDEILYAMLANINGHDNLWWLDQALLNDEITHGLILNVLNSLKIKVEVWNGNEWVYQMDLIPNAYLDEIKLLNLDLTNINTSNLQVRLTYPAASGYYFNNISIDYSDDLEIEVTEMTLVSAFLNGNLDIYNLMIDDSDNLYVELGYKDSARLGFIASPLKEGYTRVIGTKASGYIYAADSIVTDELSDSIIGKSFAEIVDIILNSNRSELVDYVDAVEELYYALLMIGSLEYEELLLNLFGFIQQEQ